jgi:phosphoribosylformylglycinamidine cyclo-ligase
MSNQFHANTTNNQNLTYESSGVNIKAGGIAVDKIKTAVKRTYNENILSNLGAFGSALSLKQIINDYDEPVLVQSTDGVGTKLIIAQTMNKFEGIGQDVVSNNVNDMLCMGAKAISFLDYIGCSKLDPEQMRIIVEGMVSECEKYKIALVGGEMAEMPGVYVDGEVDVVGFVTGVVEKSKIIDPRSILEGDEIIGIASSGLHTNGFSMARKIIELSGINYQDAFKELHGTSIGESLLAPHVNYTNQIQGVLDSGIGIKGLSHITGGGFIENIPRILPDGLDAQIQIDSFPQLPIFDLLKKLASCSGYNIEQRELYRTWNMGIGMVVVCEPDNSEQILSIINSLNQLNSNNPKAYKIGKITKSQSQDSQTNLI